MQIETIKQTQNGYLVNNSMSVPNDPANSDYQAVQQWIAAGGIVEPEFTDEELLANAKTSKISQLKSNRNTANAAPMVSHQGKELIEVGGEFTLTKKDVYFSFGTKPTGNPATEPSSICFVTILNGLANPSYYMRYSCTIIEGETTRKGYVALTPSLASTLMTHAEQRNSNNIHLCNTIEKEINNCSTVEEVDLVNISFN